MDSLPTIEFLLVDDLENNLVALEAVLERDGLECLKARSGDEALELLLEHDVSLAIIDVQMPEMDGFELAELMRGTERTRHIPIVFVTAEPRDRRRLFAGYDAGAVDFLFKPLDPHILRSKTAIFFELSRQKQLLAAKLRERDRLATQLAETLRLNEMFVAALGHDMRTPLSSMILGAQMVQQLTADERLVELARRIAASGERASRILDDLYDLARARLGGGLRVERRSLSLASLLAGVIDECRHAWPRRAIVFESVGDLEGQWDGDRLSRLAANLLGNALRHGIDGKVVVRIDGTDADQVVLTVKNPGTVPEDVRRHLFDPFRAAAEGKPQSRGNGLGLGLYIVRQIAEAHGGSVEHADDDGHSTTFRVCLPRGETGSKA